MKCICIQSAIPENRDTVNAVHTRSAVNRRFVPMDDRVVLDHLQGRHVIGVYPMLLDETCWFLAADFDGEGWKEDGQP